jgi:hypothetical protein
MQRGEVRAMDEGATSPRGAVLPSDGKLIFVSKWRRQVVVACFLCFALIYVAIAVASFTHGSTFGVLWGTGALVWGVWAIRIPLTGLILEPQGIKVRAPLWTYHYSWQEIKSFELVERPISPYAQRFLIHLSDGRVRKVRGFFARGSAEEEGRQEIMKALEARLAQGREQ